MIQEGAPYIPLKNELNSIWQNGGVNAELYKAVRNWRGMIEQNGGKPLIHSFEDTQPEELVESIGPLLLGVDDATGKAKLYFIDLKSVEEIGDEKFGHRARLWERMVSCYQAGGIIKPDQQNEHDVAGLVMGVLLELEPEIKAELGREFENGEQTTV